MFTEKQIAYAEDLRKKAHQIVEDAKTETFQHPAFTESKRGKRRSQHCEAQRRHR